MNSYLRPWFSGRGRSAAGLAFLVSGWLFVSSSQAQFLRLGPFDIDAKASLDAIYTSNIDGVRPSEATERMNDYYLIGRLVLDANADFGKHIRVHSSFNIFREKHFLRPDLDDNSRSDPFGKINLSTDMDFGRYVLNVFYNHDSTYERKEGQFVDGARSKRTYRISDDYGTRLSWRRGRLDWALGFRGGRDRYVEDEYKDGDQDTWAWDFNISWQMTKRIATFYTYSRNRTKLLNKSESYDGWDENERAGATFLLIQRPNSTYSFSMTKQDSQGEVIPWEPSHIFSVSDTLDLSKTLKLSGDANYTIQQSRGINDIAFTYGATLDHQLAQTARQNLRASREPAETFGSTVATDSTTVNYMFNKQDLFIYNLALTLGLRYNYSRPMSIDDGEPETTWTYTGNLAWTRRVSRKIQRIVSYNYRRDTSDQYDEDIQEHRFTISYDYTF